LALVVQPVELPIELLAIMVEQAHFYFLTLEVVAGVAQVMAEPQMLALTAAEVVEEVLVTVVAQVALAAPTPLLALEVLEDTDKLVLQLAQMQFLVVVEEELQHHLALQVAQV
jgi:hypothetical protein